MSIYRNGSDWSNEELAMLLAYKAVKLEHLAILIPTQTTFDIERKINQLKEMGIETIDDLREKVGDVQW